jgi:hypothetical protein
MLLQFGDFSTQSNNLHVLKLAIFSITQWMWCWLRPRAGVIAISEDRKVPLLVLHLFINYIEILTYGPRQFRLRVEITLKEECGVTFCKRLIQVVFLHKYKIYSQLYRHLYDQA